MFSSPIWRKSKPPPNSNQIRENPTGSENNDKTGGVFSHRYITSPRSILLLILFLFLIQMLLVLRIYTSNNDSDSRNLNVGGPRPLTANDHFMDENWDAEKESSHREQNSGASWKWTGLFSTNRFSPQREKAREHPLLVQMWNQQQIHKYPHILRDSNQDSSESQGTVKDSTFTTSDPSPQEHAIAAARHFTPHPDCIPIVIYVHNRPKYFRKVLQALADNVRIHETLVIVSHDGLYPEMIEIVRRELTFCAWIELVHPRTYEFSTAVMRLTYHWWWLQEQLWNRFNFDHVLFLEEDHEVSPDFYISALFMRKVHERIDPELDFTVGFSLYFQWSVPPDDNVNTFKLQLRNHAGGHDNTAYCYSRKLWNKVIAPKKQFFFEWNDKIRAEKRSYGWDVVMNKIFSDYTSHTKSLPQNNNRDTNWWLVPALSRVRNIGVLGMHTNEQFKDTISISPFKMDKWEQRFKWEPKSVDLLKEWHREDRMPEVPG